jgi:hypothetical protein
LKPKSNTRDTNYFLFKKATPSPQKIAHMFTFFIYWTICIMNTGNILSQEGFLAMTRVHDVHKKLLLVSIFSSIFCIVAL